METPGEHLDQEFSGAKEYADMPHGEYAPPNSAIAAKKARQYKEELANDSALIGKGEIARDLMQGIKHKRVSESDPVYREVKDESVEKYRQNDRHIFGAEALRNIDWARDDVSKNPDNQDRANLTINAHLSQTKESLQRFINEHGQSPRLVEHQLRHELVAAGKIEQNDDLEAKLEAMPLTEFEDFLRLHVDAERKMYEVWNLELEKYRDKFVKKITDAVEKGDLPHEASMNLNKMGKAEMSYFDPLSLAQKPSGSDTIGYFNDQEMGIFLIDALRNDRAVEEHVVNHELLHLISGKTSRIRKHKDGAKWPSDMRVGLMLEGDFRSGRSERFSWLNEGVTEMLALKLDESGQTFETYDTERALFGQLQARVPQQLFLDAYFENYEPGQGVPKWHALNKAVDEAYERGFLLKLDKLIQEHGAERTLFYLHSINNPEQATEAA